MKICGLQKTTLLDYPGHVAATLFLSGCNMRCPFCHNADLVNGHSIGEFSIEEVLSFLKKRQGVLEGVCITGGEPTLNEDLDELIKSIKELGYLIKLDTNGLKPEVIKQLYESGLIDYVAMDIKSSLSTYSRACGIATPNVDAIKESIHYIMNCGVDYEFRTTLVKGIHTISDVEDIANTIKGAKAYYLQSYKESDNILNNNEYETFDKSELDMMLTVAKSGVPNARLRGTE